MPWICRIPLQRLRAAGDEPIGHGLCLAKVLEQERAVAATVAVVQREDGQHAGLQEYNHTYPRVLERSQDRPLSSSLLFLKSALPRELVDDAALAYGV